MANTVQINQLLKTEQGRFGKGDVTSDLSDDEAAGYVRRGWATWVVPPDGAQPPAEPSGGDAPTTTADDDAEAVEDAVAPPADDAESENEDEDPFPCPHCPKGYKTEGWLNRHLEDEHPDE